MEINHPPNRVPREDLPMLARFPNMSTNTFFDLMGLNMNVRLVSADGRKYILKKHRTTSQDLIFRRELEAYVMHGLSSPHIVELLGYTVDAEDKIEAMVLKFSLNYDLRWYIQDNCPSDWKLKHKWVAQITHGLMMIHKAGITHGDLRCENVVLDENLDARIIDVVKGQGLMEGWCPWRFRHMESCYEPSWDIYSLGVSIWEILTNGETPPENQALQFEFDLSNDELALLLKGIAKRCVSDYPKDRPSAEGILHELGGQHACGCEGSIG